jgi:hypothetical protein
MLYIYGYLPLKDDCLCDIRHMNIADDYSATYWEAVLPTHFITQLVYVLAGLDYGRGLLKNPIASPNRHPLLAGVDTETKMKDEWRNVPPHGHPLTDVTPTAGPCR